MAQVTGLNTRDVLKVWFERREMDAILRLYGRMVVSGEARDYAIDMLEDRAVFAIYRRAAEAPSYRIEKVPSLARRQGAFIVYGMAGQILRRGHDIEQILRVFERRSIRAVD